MGPPWTSSAVPKTRAAWKAYERVVMTLLGGKRIPVTGRTGLGMDPGDGELAGFYVEIRTHARARPIRWYKETVQEAKAAGGVPLLVFKGPSSALSPLVILRLEDFAEVLRRAGRAGDPRPDPAGEDVPAAAEPGHDQGTRPGPRGRTGSP